MVRGIEADRKRKAKTNGVIYMSTMQDDILIWHKSTFPNATKDAIFDKLCEEHMELADELAKDVVNVGELLDEVADVYIVATSLANKFGVSLDGFIRSKMVINKKRTWGDEIANGDRPRNKG